MRETEEMSERGNGQARMNLNQESINIYLSIDINI
jgi:hypothetical protein